MGRLYTKYRLHLCRTVGWHTPGKDPRNITIFDGASLHAVCKYCTKDIMQDSQGGWF